MKIKRNRIILSVALLGALATGNATLHAYYSPHTMYSKFKNAIDELKANLRKQYSSPESLKHYGISYNQLNSIITDKSEQLLQHSNYGMFCDCAGRKLQQFEQELRNIVRRTLEQHAQQNHAIQGLSASDVRNRIEAHELKLREQYGKADQLEYYKVSYQKVQDTIKEVSRGLFSNNDGSMVTTEVQLNELFRIHTDAVLAKLREHRDR